MSKRTFKTQLILSLSLSVLFVVALLPGCVSQTGVLQDETAGQVQLELVTVSVAEENLRELPKGAKLGVANQGESFPLLEQRGNWCRIEHHSLGELWIWAKSVSRSPLNPMNLNSFLKTSPGEEALADLMGRMGEVSRERNLGGTIRRFIYSNSENPFGNNKFKEIGLTVDESRSEIIGIDIQLPPFSGDAKGLLDQLGLSKVKSSSSDFERVRYDKRYDGIYRVDLLRKSGDFSKFSHAKAYKFEQERWRRYVKIAKKNAKQMGNSINVILTVENKDSAFEYAGPHANIQLFEGSRSLGKWQLGPADVRLPASDTLSVVYKLPLDASAVDVSKLGLRAELLSMTIVGK